LGPSSLGKTNRRQARFLDNRGDSEWENTNNRTDRNKKARIDK